MHKLRLKYASASARKNAHEISLKFSLLRNITETKRRQTAKHWNDGFSLLTPFAKHVRIPKIKATTLDLGIVLWNSLMINANSAIALTHFTFTLYHLIFAFIPYCFRLLKNFANIECFDRCRFLALLNYLSTKYHLQEASKSLSNGSRHFGIKTMAASDKRNAEFQTYCPLIGT